MKSTRLAYDILDQQDQALRDYNEAIRLYPCAAYYETRASYYRSIDRYDLAQQDVAVARKLRGK